MKTVEKEKQLKKHKLFATGLFFLMAVVFVVATLIQKNNSALWIGYTKAFSEAAMVGALADWFAVTALFHHPFGLKIPHTNLIENSKEKIGDNLGSFVVDNFLSPQNIKPYILKIKISTILGNWLAVPNNREKLLNEISVIAKDIISQLDDAVVVAFINKKAIEASEKIQLNKLLSQGLNYLLEENEHQKMISYLSANLKNYIQENKEMIRGKVSDKSYAFVPKFFDDKIADKITEGLADYFSEVETDIQHPLRAEITNKLNGFVQDILVDESWKLKLDQLKSHFISPEKLHSYSEDIWTSLKKSLVNELDAKEGLMKQYLEKNIYDLSYNLQNDVVLQEKTDRVVRSTVYKYFLRNKNRFGELISETIGNWKGKELSQKLELEVGKDLQFIRINGTLVGGLVGLIIYTVSHFLSN